MNPIRRVLFVGSKQLGLQVLKEVHSIAPDSLAAVLTIDDSSDTRSVAQGFRRFCDDHKVPLHVAKNRKHSEELIQELRPEFCLVVGWYWLIGEATLNQVPRGCIGIHNSLLPRYRGGSPLIWPILNDEKEVGFSFFSLTSGIDDGDIWAQGSISIEESDFIGEILQKFQDRTVEVVRDVYPSILDGTRTPIPQNHSEATYCAQRSPSDGKIDWHRPARSLYNFIRAQSDPYPGAFTFFKGKEMKVWKARLFEHRYWGTPGQVARVAEEGIFVIGGDNKAIILEEVSIGEQRGPANEFIKSFKVRFPDDLQES